MASLNISMPDDLRDFVSVRAQQTSHATPTEYIRSLVREDQKRAEQEKLEKFLLDGLSSGKPTVVEDIDAYLGTRKRLLLAHLKSKSKAKR
jgi:antitoxin ParD1/3/4